MTTVKELTEWLKRFPEDTEVEFAVQDSAQGYDVYGEVHFISPKLDESDWGEGWEFMHSRNNTFVKKTILRIGERC